MLMYMLWVPDREHAYWHGLIHDGTSPIWGLELNFYEKIFPVWEEELREGRATLVVYDTEANTLEDVL